jgi:hypothetical protein
MRLVSTRKGSFTQKVKYYFRSVDVRIGCLLDRYGPMQHEGTVERLMTVSKLFLFHYDFVGHYRQRSL